MSADGRRMRHCASELNTWNRVCNKVNEHQHWSTSNLEGKLSRLRCGFPRAARSYRSRHGVRSYGSDAVGQSCRFDRGYNPLVRINSDVPCCLIRALFKVDMVEE